jgi:hypothetical protein
MKTSNLALAAIVSTLMVFPLGASAEITRDCVVEGTVKQTRDRNDGERVYVAFHSAKPAEEGAPCRMNRREKFRFKAPTSSDLRDAEPGTEVRYRYTEDSEKGATWKLQNASR